MNKHPLSLVIGAVLLGIFVAILFAFQVRQTEVAVVTTFGKYSRKIDQPGLNFRLPWPIQKVYSFDNRIRNFERKYEQTTTSDARIVLITIYIGWKIADPERFLEAFNGDTRRAEQNLENLVRDTKNGVIGQHPFRDLISPRAEDVKFDQIEKEMLAAIHRKARKSYGIDVAVVGIKQLGLPESNTAKVFERMREERQRLVKQFQGEGEAEAIKIRAEADRKRREILAEAQAKATIMRGEADATANEYYQEFEKSPDLAIFLLELKALEAATKDKTTLILDQRTRPFNLLNGLHPAPTKATHPNEDSKAPGKKLPAAVSQQVEKLFTPGGGEIHGETR